MSGPRTLSTQFATLSPADAGSPPRFCAADRAGAMCAAWRCLAGCRRRTLDRERQRRAHIVRTHSPKYGPVATVAIPQPVALPVVLAAIVATKPAPVPAPVPAVAPPKVPPPPSPVVPVALRAPAPERFERSPGGDALAAWRRHAVSVDVAPGTPVIAIVIDDMGLDQNSLDARGRLQGAAHALLPALCAQRGGTGDGSAPSRPRVADASADGAAGPRDPGPNALTIGMLAGEITIRVSESSIACPTRWASTITWVAASRAIQGRCAR